MSTIATTTDRKRGKAPLSDRAKGERALGWRLAGPAFVIMLLVTAYPILQAIWDSLFNFRLTDPSSKKFVGLQNYATILGDHLFWTAVLNTVIITVVTVVVELILGFALAMLMNKVVWPRKALRTIVLIPYSIITVVSAFAWFYGFQVSTGFVNHWLHFLTQWAPGGGWDVNFDWFGGRLPALVVICLSEIWKTTPFMSLLLLSGLAQIDGAMEEAALVDGATFWQRIFRVILPNMKAAIMVAVLFRTLDAFRIFDNVFIMTQGSHDTMTFSLLAYNQTINRVEIGMGSAISVLLFISVLIIAGIFVRGFKVDLTGGRG